MLKLAQSLLAAKFSNNPLPSRQYGCESAFSGLKPVPPVEVFHLTKLYQEDKNEKKVNLGVGAYRTEDNKPFILPVVKKCELEIVNDSSLNHEYLPIRGNPEFVEAATKLILGNDSKVIKEKRYVGVQTISGTGGIRLAAEFMCQNMGRRICYVSKQTWGNHLSIFKQAGCKQINTYPYWNVKKRKLDISKLLVTLCSAPEGAIVLLHGAAHNPTGMDPTKKEWKQIAEVIKCKKHFPFFDVAYQGFASGDIEDDAWAVRHFVNAGMETIIVQSFAKNMGLYNERIGNLVVVLNDSKDIPAVASQLAILVRINYSNPPAFGSRIVAKVLNDKANRDEWISSLKEMAGRIKRVRCDLRDKLTELKTPGNWDHIVKQQGMFSFTGLQPNQCEKLVKEKHIYLLKSGRISLSGINNSNIDYVAKSISEVVKEK